MANRAAVLALLLAGCALHALAATAEDVMVAEAMEEGATDAEREAAFTEGWLRKHLAKGNVVRAAPARCTAALRAAAAAVSQLRRAPGMKHERLRAAGCGLHAGHARAAGRSAVKLGVTRPRPCSR
jgi:hypothetical protein